MENVQTPERWVLIRVVGARVAESFKLLAGWSTPNQKKEVWTFTTAITSARRSENGVILSTASEHFDVSTQRDSYAFNVKTAEIFVKMHRIASNNGMTFHVVDENQVMETLKRFVPADAEASLPDALS